MIRYLNTDLDLVSSEDLTALAACLDAQGIYPLHVAHREDNLWYATFETCASFDQPELNLAMMLAGFELLDEAAKRMWWACATREFNLGYEGGSQPWGFSQVISSQTLHRIAQVGASLRITLYPPQPVNPAG